MNALDAHNLAGSTVNRIFSIHRSNDQKTGQYLELIEHKQDVSKQTTVNEAIDDLRVGNYVKGTIINMMA